MLKDRGYNINDDEMSEDKINNYWKDWKFESGDQKQVKAETYQKLMTDVEDPEIAAAIQTKIAVFWKCDQEKINTEEVKMVEAQCEFMNSIKRQQETDAGGDPLTAPQITKAILIAQDQTSLTKKYDTANNITLEIFTLDELQVNITQHQLVPTHSILTPEAKKELLDKYKIKEHQLPKI